MARKSSPDGNSAATKPTPNLKVPVNDDVLKRVYGLMLKCRLKEERDGADAATSEAALAGAVVELTSADSILATTPGPLVESVNGPSIIPTDGSGSSHLAIAAGVALAAKLRNKEDVVVVFADAAKLAFGASYEALAFAATQKLPLVVFVRATRSVPAGEESSILRTAEAHRIPGLMVDVNDAVAIYRVGKEAIHHARAGRGPSVIECCPSEVDALEHMRSYLKKQGTWSEEGLGPWD